MLISKYERKEKEAGRHTPTSFSFLLRFCILLLLCATACNSPGSSSSTVISPLLGPYHVTLPPSRSPVGKLVFSDTRFPDTVNPLFASTTVDSEVMSALWAQPVFYDEQFHVHPDQLTEVPLPENGDVLDQGKTIIMHLRHDLRWSDGEPLQARDFLFWWQLNQNPDTGATTTSGYDQIATITTPDVFTVVLHMKHAYGPYLSYLPLAAPFHAWGKLRPIDLQNMASIYQTPLVTSGPYKIASWQSGKSYTLAANTYYVSSTFRGPFVAQLIYQTYPHNGMPESSAQLQMSDVTLGYTESDLPSLARPPSSLRLLKAPAASYEHLDFNLAHPLLQDSQVRRAMQLAIDVCGMLRSVVHEKNCARRATQVELPPSLYYDTALRAAAYDPDQAKKLLAQAGWLPDKRGILMKNAKPFVLHLVTTARNPLRLATATYIQQQLRLIGIQVSISTFTLNAFFAGYTRGGVLATGNYDVALFTYANGPEPDAQYDVFHSSHIPSSTQSDLGNYGRVQDTVIDAALDDGRATTQFPARVQAYRRFLDRVVQQTYTIPLYTDITVIVLNRQVENMLPNPNQFALTWNISDWWRS